LTTIKKSAIMQNVQSPVNTRVWEAYRGMA